jgi:predicted nucleotidyltransferase component of viral defense system
LLEYFADRASTLVFKGGTCLAKVHAGFYRLSEYLDFTIPSPLDAMRVIKLPRHITFTLTMKRRQERR